MPTAKVHFTRSCVFGDSASGGSLLFVSTLLPQVPPFSGARHVGLTNTLAKAHCRPFALSPGTEEGGLHP